MSQFVPACRRLKLVSVHWRFFTSPYRSATRALYHGLFGADTVSRLQWPWLPFESTERVKAILPQPVKVIFFRVYVPFLSLLLELLECAAAHLHKLLFLYFTLVACRILKVINWFFIQALFVFQSMPVFSFRLFASHGLAFVPKFLIFSWPLPRFCFFSETIFISLRLSLQHNQCIPQTQADLDSSKKPPDWPLCSIFFSEHAISKKVPFVQFQNHSLHKIFAVLSGRSLLSSKYQDVQKRHMAG